MKKTKLRQLIRQIINEQSKPKKCCEDTHGNITNASSYPTGKCPKSQDPVVCESARPRGRSKVSMAEEITGKGFTLPKNAPAPTDPYGDNLSCLVECLGAWYVYGWCMIACGISGGEMPPEPEG
tara:strand:+ start:65 stop:436 length:372 start_codon:yes stop_codon:yes gene_type:complete